MRNPALFVSRSRNGVRGPRCWVGIRQHHASPKPTYQPVIPSDLRMRRLAARADDLYREIRVENDATGKSGEKLI